MERLMKGRLGAREQALRTGEAGSLRDIVERWLGAVHAASAGQGDRLLRLARAWTERYRIRRDMERLDERTLRDMGVTRYDITQETRKPFWRD